MPPATAPASSSQAPQADAGVQTPQVAADEQAPQILIGPGDLLNVDVFDTPELSGPLRVGQNGAINMTILGTVQVEGLNAKEAARAIENALRAQGILVDPHVTVGISEFASQGATVMGEVRQPGLYPTLGSRTLLDMLAVSGGPMPTAGKIATIIHRDDPQHPINVALAPNARALAHQQNPVILPGDIIVINKSGVIYILGDVTRPGGFLIDSGEHLSLMQALTLAGGWDKTAALSRAILVRKVPAGREEVKLDLKHVTFGQQADVSVEDGDILYIPSSLGKTLAYRGLEAIISGAQTAAVYANNY
jgi:polysaccharide export outer membrane protein